MYCCSIQLCSRPGGRAACQPGPRAWLPPPAQRTGPRQKRMRSWAPNEAARRRTWGGPADSSKARALLTKFTVPRLPRLFSRLIGACATTTSLAETENSWAVGEIHGTFTSSLTTARPRSGLAAPFGARDCTRRIAASRPWCWRSLCWYWACANRPPHRSRKWATCMSKAPRRPTTIPKTPLVDALDALRL